MCLSCAVSEILDVEQWRALEVCVDSHSRSLKMAPLRRSHTTSYQSAIVSIALSRTVFNIFDAEEHCDLEI